MSSELESVQQRNKDLLTELDEVNSERETLKFRLAEKNMPTSSNPLKKRPPPPLDFDGNAQLEAQVGILASIIANFQYKSINL